MSDVADAISGGFDDLFGGSKSTTIDPFSGEDRGKVINPLIDQIAGIRPFFDPKALQASFRPNQQLLQSSGLLTGFSPQSFFQGGQGGLGNVYSLLGQGESALSRAAGTIGQDRFGAQDFFSRTLSPGYLDVANDPQLNAALDAVAARNQRFLNQNADLINASTQRASGGIGAGTAATNQLSRLTSDVANQIAGEQSGLLLNEQARRSGQQLAAGQQALGRDLQEAQALGGLAGQFGGLAGLGTNLGSTLAGLTLQQAQGLQGLGGVLQQLQQSQQMLPLDLQMQLASLLKSDNVSGPSAGIVNRFGEGMGSLGEGLTSLFGA